VTFLRKATLENRHGAMQSQEVTSELDLVDLYSGAGGLSLGGARAGFSIRGAVEFDSHAIKTHKTNFPKTIHIEKDIAGISGSVLLTELGLGNKRLTGIIGGPPCQGFSSIGRNEKDDPRNKLFVHFFRIVGEVQPKFFLAENVPGILNRQYDYIRAEAFRYVENKYTILPPLTLSANEYGAPTTRTRVFFIGFLSNEIKGLSVDDFIPPSRIKKISVQNALQGLPQQIDPNWKSDEECWRKVGPMGNDYFSVRLKGKVPISVGDEIALTKLHTENKVSGFIGTAHSKKVIKRFAKVKPGSYDSISKCRRLELVGFCPTLRAGTGPDRGSYQAVRPIHPTEDRVITPREAARLQGFPDWFQFPPTKWHSFRQIGNSVSPILAERILSVIRCALGSVGSQEEL